MGLIERLFALAFGGGNVVRDTAEVFRVNAEAQASRDTTAQMAALRQFAAEFAPPQRGWFDRLMDALNRVPRPALALGTLALFVSAMVDPVWFAARMTGIALVPEPMWWLLGAIVSFYFGARHQAKGQAFQREIAQTMASAVPVVLETVRGIEALDAAPAEDAAGLGTETNPALRDWRAAVAQDSG